MIPALKNIELISLILNDLLYVGICPDDGT